MAIDQGKLLTASKRKVDRRDGLLSESSLIKLIKPIDQGANEQLRQPKVDHEGSRTG